jgi:hypothetical protein
MAIGVIIIDGRTGHVRDLAQTPNAVWALIIFPNSARAVGEGRPRPAVQRIVAVRRRVAGKCKVESQVVPIVRASAVPDASTREVSSPRGSCV